jgi:acyl-CoA synthetase (NDP forming)
VRTAEPLLVSPERLAEFFAPRSIALVGASETSGWARFVVASAHATGFTGSLIPVHPRHQTVFGKPAARSLRDLAEPVDLAFILAPTHAVEGVLDDAGAAGVRGAIVLASGYREAGHDGRTLEDRLVATAITNGITLLGPNCLGFVNAHDRTAPFALSIPQPLLAGPVGIALQSGALGTVVLGFARARAIGVSTLATLGNEAMLGVTDMLEFLIADDRTRAICLFLEEISDPATFAAAAAKADQAGKPIVALKAGSSQVGIQAALAHTGALAGDDAVVDAALRQLNVIRVTSIEELLSTGALLGCQRWPRGRRMGVLTASGGACDIIADRASAEGIEIPPFAAETEAAIRPHLPSFATVHNPLDVTGHFLADQRSSVLLPIDLALLAATSDPGLDFVLVSGPTLPEVKPAGELALRIEERLAWLGEQIASAPIPVIPMSPTCVDVSGYARELLTANGIHQLGGIDVGLRALGSALRWLEGRGRAPARWNGAAPPGAWPDGPWSEADARAWLAGFGVPVVPGELAGTADQAAAAAGRIGYPVALKICSARITHKSDVGGVALWLASAAEVRSAYQRVRAAGQAAVGAARAGPGDVDGVLVTAMRDGGVELLAGVTVDPTFGPVLAVGLGGIWVEVLADVSMRVLPVDPAEVRRMLGELRALPLLAGARGRKAADLDAVARVIARLGDAACALGGSLRSLEVNPLWVHGDQIEALDAVIVTRAAQGAREGNDRP